MAARRIFGTGRNGTAAAVIWLTVPAMYRFSSRAWNSQVPVDPVCPTTSGTARKGVSARGTRNHLTPSPYSMGQPG